jgi:hypothetical protein
LPIRDAPERAPEIAQLMAYSPRQNGIMYALAARDAAQ